jgi:type I restriction enzyme S subunit
VNTKMRLGDLAIIDFGFPFKSAKFSTEGPGTKLVRGDNIGQGRLRMANAKIWPSQELAAVKYDLEQGDVVLAMDRPWVEAGLKQAIVRNEDLPALLVQRVARLRARSEVLDQGFLGAIVGGQAFSEYLVSIQTGSAIPHISGSQIAAFQVSVPSLSEQQAIAEVLGALDDKIAANTKLAATAEAFAVMTLGKSVEKVPLSEISALCKDTLDPSALGEADVDHFSLPAFDAGAHPVEECADQIKSNKFLIGSEAVLLSKLNPRIPRIWRVRPNPDRKALASTEFLVLKPCGVSPELLWAALAQTSFSAELSSKVSGTSGSHQRVKPSDVLSTHVTDPRSLPASIAGSLNSALLLASRLVVENRTLAEARDALLPQLMSGKLRVRDAEKPASEAGA